MPSTTVLISLGILVFSFVGGFLFFYVTSTNDKKMKKQQLDEIISLLINFIIYIWIGKILINFAKFIKDPLAILAYPSNSGAFYIATVMIIVNILYRIRRKNKQMSTVLQSFIQVFLGASFIYEFLQVIVEGNRSGWPYLTFLMVLLLLFILLHGKVPQTKNMYIIFLTWVSGQLVLSIIFSYTTIFGYMIAPMFFISLLIIILLLIMYRRKGQV